MLQHYVPKVRSLSPQLTFVPIRVVNLGAGLSQSNRYPKNVHNDIQTKSFLRSVLVRPEPIGFKVPIAAGCTMHSSFASCDNRRLIFRSLGVSRFRFPLRRLRLSIAGVSLGRDIRVFGVGLDGTKGSGRCGRCRRHALLLCLLGFGFVAVCVGCYVLNYGTGDGKLVLRSAS